MATATKKASTKEKLKHSKAQYMKWYEDMLLIRKFEEKTGQLYIQQKFGGFCHLYNGQEAIVAGTVSATKKGDKHITAYRDHAHPIALGVHPKYVMAELYGKTTGLSKGKGGSMHMFDVEKGLMGGHGIVGAQIPMGAGIAFAEKYNKTKNVCITSFGDGAASVILSSYEDEVGPKIVDEAMYHFYDATTMMGFKLVNTGLQMILDKAVPETISEHFPMIVHPFLERNNITIEDIDHLIFHPGGKKIVQTVEDLFGSLGKNIDDTKEVLRLYGNMSSATVLYVLERFLDRPLPKGDRGLMLSFGPGFSAQRILLEW